MLVVVLRDQGDPAFERHTAIDQMDTPTPPLRGRQSPEENQGQPQLIWRSRGDAAIAESNRLYLV